MKSVICNRCEEKVDAIIQLKFFANTNKKSDFGPKYNFVVKAICPKCNNWVKHLPQNDLLIGYINGKLEDVNL